MNSRSSLSFFARITAFFRSIADFFKRFFSKYFFTLHCYILLQQRFARGKPLFTPREGPFTPNRLR